MTEPRQLADRVAKLLAAGDLNGAGKLVDAAAASDPAGYEIGYTAIALYKRDVATALDRARHAIELGAGALGHHYLALALLVSGEREAAIDAARRAVALDGSPRGRAGLGSVLLAAGRPYDAAAVLRQVLAEAPTDGDALVNLATACAQLGEYREAITCYARAFEADPADPKPIQNLIAMFAELGKWLGAAAALELACEQAPPPEVAVALDVARLHLVRLIAEKFPPPEVGADADRAVRSAVDDALGRGAKVQLQVARTLVELGRAAEARPIAEQLAHQPLGEAERANLLYVQGALARSAGDAARALELYGEALAIDPGHVAACVDASHLLLEDGSPAALARIGALVEAVPPERRTPELAFNEAAYLARTGRRDAARDRLERVLRVAGPSAPLGQLARRALAELGTAR